MELAHHLETGQLGIYYLKRIWSSIIAKKRKSSNTSNEEVEWQYINAVFNTLGVGIEPTFKYLLLENNTFEEFEHWIIKNGRVSKPVIQNFNAAVQQEAATDTFVETTAPLTLSKADLKHWQEEGYVVIKQAIPFEDCEKTKKLIYDFIGADEDNPDSWYEKHPAKQGIMIQLFNHEILDKNRLSTKIRIAYEQLWNRKDLIVNMDRVSFNPPETASYHFQGPNLHWDISIQPPIPYGVQGLLYLADTPANQGAFTLVPGFHNKIDSWLKELPEGVNPRELDLAKLGARPIAGEAGDFIIWHQALPHGSSPNLAKYPRIVQYINYQPITLEVQDNWL